MPLPIPSGLEGKTVVVTGGSRGIGRAIVDVFAGDGADVTFFYRDNAEAADAVVAAARAARHTVAAERVDVRDAASCVAAVERIADRTGRIDVLVNNAGVALTRPALQTDEEAWRSVLDTNLDGAFRVARAVAQTMVADKRGGAIVNVASILALRVAKQVAAYVAAKAGLLRLTEALALEWAAHGIRVNALAPGYVETELNRDFLRSPAGESLGKRVPMRRFGTPEDLDGALLLLASDAGRYLTGATITVDGGHALAWL